MQDASGDRSLLRAARAGEAGHVGYNPKNGYVNLLTESELLHDIAHGNILRSCDNDGAVYDGRQVTETRRVNKMPDLEGADNARCNRQMLICSARRAVHNQHIDIL
jgi:hypothetical protein